VALALPAIATATSGRVTAGDSGVLTSYHVGGTSCQESSRTCGISLAINIYDNTQLNFVLHDVSGYIRTSDLFVLVSGNNANPLSTQWLNQSATALKLEFPGNEIFAYTAGTKNIAVAAKDVSSSISGIIYGYEPGMSNEPEFRWTMGTTLRNMESAASDAIASGKEAGAAPTGRPLLESDLLQYGWQYGQLSNQLNLTIVQTQTWARKGPSSFAHAVALLQEEYAGTAERWMPQLTVDSTDGNGIAPQAAYQDTQVMESDHLNYVSIWFSNATSYFATYLSMLRAPIATPPGTATSSIAHAVVTTRLAGSTADATAADALFHAFPWTRTTCPGRAGGRPVVLASDESSSDALAASYLAGWLKTGILLTPPDALSTPAGQALRDEGITQVYIVGGPLAVSAKVAQSIESRHATSCGGDTVTTRPISVNRVYGSTAYTTARYVALQPGAAFVGGLDLAAAYGGSGLYNATDGSSSAPPTRAGALASAIVATGAEFQDAESAATLSYSEHLPLLLTSPTALSQAVKTAIESLGVEQIIVMGGPLAVSTAVVSALEGLGLSVLRVAGTTYMQTATELASLELASNVSELGAGWAPTGGVVVARGDVYSDGLAGAVVAAGVGTRADPEPMLLTENPNAIGPPLSELLKLAGAQGIDSDGTVITHLVVLGGPLAVTTVTVQAMVTDLGD
jgi:putative cell wall-binding protein